MGGSPLMLWFTFALLTFVTYRVAHLVIFDSLFEEPREKLLDWLATVEVNGVIHVADKKREPHLWFAEVTMWKRKLYDLLTCPYCFTIWTAAGTVILHDVFIDPNLPLPVWYWIGISTTSLLIWKYVDGDE